MVIKKVSLIIVMALVVAGLAIVAIGKYQRVIQPAIARGLVAATDSGDGLANLEADTLILSAKATAAPEFAQGNWINSDSLSLEIKYPVITDNEYKTWNAYGVEAWPTLFVLDKLGHLRWKHVGEGRYEETEDVIRTLLAE